MAGHTIMTLRVPPGIHAIYPGTFDPITHGHVDIAVRAARLFDRVTVAIAGHGAKKPVFSQEERLALARPALEFLPNVAVTAFSGLLAHYVQQIQAQVIVRGLRAVSDFEYEFQLAGMNHSLQPGVETIFLPTSAKYTYLSSSLVREVAMLGGDVAEFVPANVLAALRAKMQRPVQECAAHD